MTKNKKMASHRNVSVLDVVSISNNMSECLKQCPEKARLLEALVASGNENGNLFSNSPLTTETIPEEIEMKSLCVEQNEDNMHNDDTPKMQTVIELKENTIKQKPSYHYETSDDLGRQELLWTNKIEEVLNEWHDNCLRYADVHDKRSKFHKKVFFGIGIPSAVIPMALASASEYMRESYQGLVMLALVFAGILNIINGFLNPGQTSESHSTFNALYNELAVEITSELVKPQKNRVAADVFIQRIMDNYNSLNNRAPSS